jgi:hypothetical protein
MEWTPPKSVIEWGQDLAEGFEAPAQSEEVSDVVNLRSEATEVNAGQGAGSGRYAHLGLRTGIFCHGNGALDARTSSSGAQSWPDAIPGRPPTAPVPRDAASMSLARLCLHGLERDIIVLRILLYSRPSSPSAGSHDTILLHHKAMQQALKPAARGIQVNSGRLFAS